MGDIIRQAKDLVSRAGDLVGRVRGAAGRLAQLHNEPPRLDPGGDPYTAQARMSDHQRAVQDAGSVLAGFQREIQGVLGELQRVHGELNRASEGARADAQLVQYNAARIEHFGAQGHMHSAAGAGNRHADELRRAAEEVARAISDAQGAMSAGGASYGGGAGGLEAIVGEALRGCPSGGGSSYDPKPYRSSSTSPSTGSNGAYSVGGGYRSSYHSGGLKGW